MNRASSPDAVLELARENLANEQFAAARDKCLDVLSSHDRHPAALSLLGSVLYAQGHYEEAVRVFNALTLTEPHVVEHWRNLGTALRPTKRYDQAIAAFDRALRMAPPSAGLLYNLGVLQMERFDYNAAYLALRDAVKLAPADATMRWGFAQCCYDLVNIDEALQTLHGWQSLTGLSVDITVRIVFLLVMMGELQSVLPTIDRLAADPPVKGRAAVGLASILERLHRLDEARALLDRIDENDPGLAGDPDKLLVSAVLAERRGDFTVSIRDLSAALENHQEFAHRYHLLFRLAKVQDSLGHYDDAFATAAEAHRSQLNFIEVGIGKAPDQESRILARTAQSCQADDVARWQEAGPSAEDSPIFIVGFPRSGTTLLEQVLDAHSQLQSMDEQPFLLRSHSEIVERGIRYPAELGALTAQDLSELRDRYWERVNNTVVLARGQRLVDKNPLNMIVLPVIRRLFPNAKIILNIRHPCDVLMSCYLQNFRAPELALLCRDLPTLARAYDCAFGYWYSQWPLLRPVSYELRYEALIADFPAEVRKLVEFLGVRSEAAMLDPGGRARAKGFVSTPSYAQVLEPVNNRSVGRWHHYERYFRDVLSTLGPWTKRWGYSTEI